MKIFNWVRGRFYHKDGFDTVDVKKPEFITNDTDGKALLENAALADLFDGWRGGILSIGTFGFDASKEFNREGKEYSYSITYKVMEEQCDDDKLEEYSVGEDEITDPEDEELNPLVYKACQHGFEKKNDHNEYEDGVPLSSSLEFGSKSNVNVESDEKGKKRERITLADLFSAESNMMIPTQTQLQLQLQPDSCGNKLVQLQRVVQLSKKTAPGKNGLSFAKKLIPRVGEDARARPIQKLNRLMTKMLKRKIHPDFEGKVPKKDGQTKSTGLFPEEFCANESISLLSTQDAIV